MLEEVRQRCSNWEYGLCPVSSFFILLLGEEGRGGGEEEGGKEEEEGEEEVGCWLLGEGEEGREVRCLWAMSS